MSQAEALLSTLAENVVQHTHTMNDTDTHFIIDPISRIMSNGVGDENVVMQFDHDSAILTFELPRIVDGHDMMLCNSVLVHWNNIDMDTKRENASVSDIYDLRVNPDNKSTVICSWKISRESLQLAGILSFLVQYKCVESGVTVYEWHTDIYSGVTVKPGRNNSEQAISEYTDILEQWREKLFGAGDTVIEEIANASEAQKASIESKGVETLATIPEDYTATYNMANDALRTRANAIAETKEGETVIAEDCSDDYLRGLHIYGKTTQIKTLGMQLAWVNINVADYPYLGVVCSATEDGNVLLHGTSTNNMWNRLASANLEAGKTYTLSAHKNVALSVWDVTADGSFAVKPAGSDSIAFVAPNTGSYSFCIENVTNTPFNYIHADIMLNEGEEVYPWEPYSNGVASPSPDYPQTLKSITDPLIGLYGKNLINIDEMELASNKSLVISSDKYTITVVGGSDKTYAYSHYDIPEELVRLVRGKTLRLSSDSVSKSVSAAYSPVQLNIKCADGTFQYPVNHDSKLYHEFFVPEDTVEIRFGVYTNNSAAVLESDNTVVVTGVHLTLAEYPEYEPYKGYQSLVLTHTLHGVPVESGGNYTDSNGQQWICDEIDFERGVYIQRVARYMFDGSDDEVWSAYDSFNGAYMINDLARGSEQYATPMLCNYAIRKSWGTGSQNNHYCFINGYDDFVIGGSDVKRLCPDLASWKAQIAITPCEVIYQLNAPIETPLTDEELFAFSQLHSNYLTTTVLNTKNAYMSLDYNADTKAYITNLIRNLNN